MVSDTQEGAYEKNNAIRRHPADAAAHDMEALSAADDTYPRRYPARVDGGIPYGHVHARLHGERAARAASR